MDATISVRVEDDVKRAAEQAAAKAGLSLSKLVRLLLDAVVDGRLVVESANISDD